MPVPANPLNLSINPASGVRGDFGFSNQVGGLVVYPEPNTGDSISRAFDQTTGSSTGSLVLVGSVALLVGALAMKAFK